MSDEPEIENEISQADSTTSENYGLNEISNPGPAPPRSKLFSVLANRHRRNVLRHLKRSETPVTLADLTDELIHPKTESSPTAIQEERERLRLSLYHCHLPKLEASNLVSFDANEKLIHLSEYADELPLDVVRMGLDEEVRDEL